MKLIDKDALVAEIDRLRIIQPADEFQPKEQNKIDWLAGKEFAIITLQMFLDTHEVKEIGVDLGDPKGDKSAKCIIDTKNLEAKEIDLCKEEERIWKDFNMGERHLSKNDLEKISKHFLELGLKAQKGK